jgi:hypothetical protein
MARVYTFILTLSVGFQRFAKLMLMGSCSWLLVFSLFMILDLLMDYY